MPEDQASGIEDYVAVCPVTPDLVRAIVELADLSWDDPKATDQAMRELGWQDEDMPTGDGRFVTDLGHVVHGDTCFSMPFSQSYQVGGEVWGYDAWGSLPGWSSRAGAGRGQFDAHVDAAIGRFAERLGPPERDVRTGGSAVSTGSYSWRYAAWRRDGNILVIGQTFEGFSYSQFEEAVVYIGALAADAPLPTAAEFPDFMICR
ncbi:hypothetical protein J4573_22710 [Actinomadura barringtoniae]|uniref:Uncharacterized protein n=1 Tax=Actinomadura barringtoniae TaxID=1427535 RepID=A0A939T842_9ACTN|nr:hypothetical protein [Actinomadura barringtoniae]MBO2449932.1 hypothetical protein [Actinomadura barringtoniae]